jgi:hypothetical protein
MQEERDPGLQQSNNSSSNRRGYGILPKGYKGGDFIAFKEGFENICRVNRWEEDIKVGHLIWCYQQGPAEIIISSRPGHTWSYDELMQAGLEMFGNSIGESEMRLELKKIKREKGESLPDLVRRIIKITRQAVEMSETKRFEEERIAFMNAIEDNRPLYYYLDRHMGSCNTISKMLSIAMKYTNQEGASDEWVLGLMDKAFAERGLPKSETSTNSTTTQNKSASKSAESEKLDQMHAYLFGDRNKPTSWEDGYKQVTERLNEDLLIRKTQHTDQKVAAQRQADAIESLRRGVEEMKQIQMEMANKPYPAPYVRPPRPQNNWTPQTGSGYQNSYPNYNNQGYQQPYSQGWGNNQGFRAPRPRFPNHAQGFRPRRPYGNGNNQNQGFRGPRPNMNNSRLPRPRFNAYEQDMFDYNSYDPQQELYHYDDYGNEISDYYAYDYGSENVYEFAAPAVDNSASNSTVAPQTAATPASTSGSTQE